MLTTDADRLQVEVKRAPVEVRTKEMRHWHLERAANQLSVKPRYKRHSEDHVVLRVVVQGQQALEISNEIQGLSVVSDSGTVLPVAWAPASRKAWTSVVNP